MPHYVKLSDRINRHLHHSVLPALFGVHSCSLHVAVLLLAPLQPQELVQMLSRVQPGVQGEELVQVQP